MNGDAGDRPGMTSRFFRRIAAHFANEAAVVTPNGKLLSHSPAEGLKKWKELAEAERMRLEDFGAYDASLDPMPPPGGLIIKVFARVLERDPERRLRLHRSDVARSQEPGRDHVWLTAEEHRVMSGEGRRLGETFSAPRAVADRIARRYLIDLVRVGGNGGPRRREEVLSLDLRLEVVAATATARSLSLTGAARLSTHDAGSGARGGAPKVDDYRILGRLEVDPARNVVTRFEAAAFSETGHFDEIHERILPLAFAFISSAGETPADRAPPSGYGKDYFAAP